MNKLTNKTCKAYKWRWGGEGGRENGEASPHWFARTLIGFCPEEMIDIIPL